MDGLSIELNKQLQKQLQIESVSYPSLFGLDWRVTVVVILDFDLDNQHVIAVANTI